MSLVADDEVELDFLNFVEASDKHLVGDDHNGQQRPLGKFNRSVLLQMKRKSFISYLITLIQRILLMKCHLIDDEDVDSFPAEPSTEFFVPVLSKTRRRDDQHTLNCRAPVKRPLMQ